MKVIFLSLLLIVSSCASLHFNSERLPASDKVVPVAVVNFLVKGEASFASHVNHIEAWAQKAHRQGAQYLLLPELLVLDLLPKNPASSEMKTHLDKLASYYHDYEKELIKISNKSQLTLIGASTVVKKGPHYLNRAFYIKPSGEIKYQDKVYPTPWEAKNGFVGGENIQVFHEDHFSFAILICHDAEFPNISSQLMKQKPEIIFVPSQTDDQNGQNRVKITSAARAIEQMSYVLMTGTAGLSSAPWHSYVGQNFFFTPQNKYFNDEKSSPANQETLSLFYLDLNKIHQSRKDINQVYPGRDAMSKN
jgi:predicted amidohydrolase